MKIHYDAGADTLYLDIFDSNEPQHYIENRTGDILHVTKGTQRIVGCTLLAFRARQKKSNIIVIPEVGNTEPPAVASRREAELLDLLRLVRARCAEEEISGYMPDLCMAIDAVLG